MLPIADNIADLLNKSFGMPQNVVGSLVFILYVGSLPFALYIGHFIEAYPQHKRNMMVGSKAVYLVLVILLVSLSETDSPSAWHYIVVVLFLVVFSFNLTVFHSIVEPITSYFIRPHLMGTSWGIIGSTLGLCQSVFSVVNMEVLSSSASTLKAYSSILTLYLIIAVLSLLIALWIRFRDAYRVLDKPYS